MNHADPFCEAAMSEARAKVRDAHRFNTALVLLALAWAVFVVVVA